MNTRFLSTARAEPHGCASPLQRQLGRKVTSVVAQLREERTDASMMTGAVAGALLTTETVHAKLLFHADAWGDPLAVSTENRGLEHRLHAPENTSCCLWFRNPADQTGVGSSIIFCTSTSAVRRSPMNGSKQVSIVDRPRGMLRIRKVLALRGEEHVERAAKFYAACL